MYPFARMLLEVRSVRNQPPLSLTGTHVSRHRCWPWDLDIFSELNNGRTLTLYDLGRFPLALRSGLVDVARRNGWGMTVAGNSTRYRRRIRAFEQVEMRSRCIGWDNRFFYIEQSMWKGDECANHILIRMAITSKTGIVTPGEVARAMAAPPQSPALPDWVQAWIAADAQRPWPPGPEIAA